MRNKINDHDWHTNVPFQLCLHVTSVAISYHETGVNMRESLHVTGVAEVHARLRRALIAAVLQVDNALARSQLFL